MPMGSGLSEKRLTENRLSDATSSRPVVATVFVFLFLVTSSPLCAADPPNSHRNSYGTGWSCDRGYYRSGQECIEVKVPENASINIYGNGWTCDRGFYKSGQECLKVKVPENADLNVYGNGWSCNRGYYKSGQNCAKVVIPEHAEIDVYGSGWVCKRGYYKSENGCKKVIAPDNASIDVYGSGWTCNKGYKKSNSVCVAMTEAELKKQKDIERAMFERIQKRKTEGVRGDHCETEYKTSAQVCVQVSRAHLSCNKDLLGEYYRDCDVTVSYEVVTDYRGGSYLDTQIECRVGIEYKGRQSYFTKSDSSSKDESHTLHAYASDSESMRFNFSFGILDEVTQVKISSGRCEVEGVHLP